MDIFALLTMLGGLALFLYGMHVMGEGLEKLSGGRLEHILEKMTDTPLKGVLLGAVVTAVIQSSSATTVMAVGFVNSGMMTLTQSIGIIMGANIGTTVTAWLLSLAGIEGSNVFISLLKPSSFSPVVAAIGVILLMFTKKQKNKDVGTILIGFAVLMFGMQTMSDAVKPLADVPEFGNILIKFSNPLLGLAAGLLLTAVIQSSSASVGILQALSATGSVSIASSIPIILGQNIGACSATLISSTGANKNAKRVAIVHLYFNLIGAAVFLGGYYLLTLFFDFSFAKSAIDASGIATIHTCFNLITTVLLFPFSKQLVKLASITLRDKEKTPAAETDSKPVIILDERFLNTPSFAVERCREATVDMAKLSHKAITDALDAMENYSQDKIDGVVKNEDKLDEYEDKLGSYLVKLSSKALSEGDSRQISKLLHSIGDFERIGDHALNISDSAKEMHKKGIKFSDEALAELEVIVGALREIVSMAIQSFENADPQLAANVEPLEQVIDDLKDELKERHINRLQKGLCTIELGFILSDVLSNIERISDHCSNIAVCVISLEESQFDTHEYLNRIKNSGEKNFTEAFRAYGKKYSLPR
ncbi:MAG: Na/Pi cotransporter family protein [Firmicutes bacterium]|nr:Na/Pi cotransporter family protein [Bacillota bacterium]